MANSLNLTAPKYAAPADWQVETLDLADPALPLILRTGTYLSAQADLDAVVEAGISAGKAIVYLDIPPMGFSDARLQNPNAFYPTPALIAEQIVAAKAAVGASINLNDLPAWIYGNSYGVLGVGAPWHTSGSHWSQLAMAAMGGGAVTGYAVGGKRILDVLSTLVNGANVTGTNGVNAAGKWTTTTARTGIVFFESMANDLAHCPTMTTPSPAALTPGSNYMESCRAMYRAALALMSSESRIESGSATRTGAWSLGVADYPSSGSFHYTTTVGDHIQFSVTPAQTGPLAGKVFLLGYSLDPAAGAICQTVNVSVDGAANVAHSISPWEQYFGDSGVNTIISWTCIPVDVPVDGAAHTVRFTHAGAASSFFYADALIIPSTTPNRIVVPGMEHEIVPGVFDQAEVNVWNANVPIFTDMVSEVLAEFPNAIYAPSSMTANGLYSGDRLHPNDRGMQQRANDVAEAVRKRSVSSRGESVELAESADVNFGVV